MKKLLLVLLSLALVAPAQAKKVSGTVKCDGKPLPDVLVTDGVSFTRTDAKGTFRFKTASDARFVHIVTPSGYVADYSMGAPRFYEPMDGRSKFHFRLRKTAATDDYALFAISDPQMNKAAHLEKFSGEPMDDLIAQSAKYSENRQFAAIALGDICWNKMNYFPLYLEQIRRIGRPFYAVIGNHDHNPAKQGLDGQSDYEYWFGPVNYAFWLGRDLVIGLSDIVWDGTTKRKYHEGYREETVAWVRALLEHVPAGTHLFIAQHSPIKLFRKGYIERGEEMVAALRGYKVDFLTGHTHYFNNQVLTPDITDRNVASLCGAWWDTQLCRDGTPRGYEIYTATSGKRHSLYHPVDVPESCRMTVYGPGHVKGQQNAVTVNVWDWDPTWKAVWYQDGRLMGGMKPVLASSPDYEKEIKAVYARVSKEKGKKVNVPGYKKPTTSPHWLAAVPDPYAKCVTVEVTDGFGVVMKEDVDLGGFVDVQAHRGGAALWPENTTPAMLRSVKLGSNTLEMDLCISKDGKVVVSHDAYFHPRIATRPDGTLVQRGDPKEYLYHFTYEEILKWDVGMRPVDRFPKKKCEPAVKPLAADLFRAVETYVAEKGYSPVRYNVEIKCRAGEGEGVNWPEYHEFVDRCIEVLRAANLGDRLIIQCFDTRALNYIHEKYPEFILAYLVDRNTDPFESYMGKLNFKPQWLSPHFSIVDEALVARCRKEGIRLVPWTPDKPEDLQRMVDLGVEAIITNCPDRLLKITRGY